MNLAELAARSVLAVFIGAGVGGVLVVAWVGVNVVWRTVHS